MDFYTFSLGLGATGLGFMAFAGVARHAGPGHATDGLHAHASDGIAHASGGHAHVLGGSHAAHAHSHGSAPIHHDGAHPSASTGPAPGPSALQAHPLPSKLGALMSPRVLFGILLGLGTAGLVLRHTLGGVPLFGAALLIGAAFERFFLTVLWNFTLRFASRPALTLETAVAGEATAVTAFDASGHGIVQLVVDGQVVQVLGTLTHRERVLGHRVRPGETLRIDEVDAQRNSCRVSLL
jgi:hypothetical protein